VDARGPVQIATRLFVGARPQERGTWGAVANVSERPNDFDDGVDSRFFMMADCVPACLDTVAKAVAFIDRARAADGAVVLVHCSRGQSRSPCIAWLYLVACCGLAVNEAYSLVIRRMPHARIKPALVMGFTLDELRRAVRNELAAAVGM